MPGIIPTDEIISKTSKGVRKAQQLYEKWSGGDWLWQAPEYLLTVCIAQEITKTPGSHFLTLENNVRATIEEAGRLRRGGQPKNLRLKGRFDIVVWWGNGVPRAVIEVKNQPSGFSSIQEDVARICSTLKAETDIRCGLIAYYLSFCSGERKEAEDRLTDRVDELSEKARNYVRNEGMRLKRYPGRVKLVGDSAWTAEVLKISR